jgi:flagellar L-ring protein precursor FlgH
MKQLSLRVLVLGVIMALAGCASVNPPLHDPAYAPTSPAVAAPPIATPGGIYSPGHGLSLYEDVRARHIGDILTIELVEETQASKEASTNTQKDQNLEMSAGTLLGGPVVHNGRPILQNSISASRDFSGEGSSSQKNSLSGNITVTVAEVLPNGNLLVRGEKALTLNQGDEFIRISGIVRPVDIRTDNSVLSTRVANANIIYGGRGALADSNRQGWLARFFNSPLWPF